MTDNYLYFSLLFWSVFAFISVAFIFLLSNPGLYHMNSDFQRMRFVRLCGYGDIERVQARIDNGATRADVNEEHCDWGETGLMLAFKNSIYAPKNSQNDLVQLLLNHPQIDVNKVDRRGACALHYAVYNDNHEGMAALLAR